MTKQMTTESEKTKQLTATELDHVVGGNTALSHEAVHDAHTPKHPVIAIIAVLIG